MSTLGVSMTSAAASIYIPDSQYISRQLRPTLRLSRICRLSGFGEFNNHDNILKVRNKVFGTSCLFVCCFSQKSSTSQICFDSSIPRKSVRISNVYIYLIFFLSYIKISSSSLFDLFFFKLGL